MVELTELPNSVRGFYRGRHVMLTGCTGFVGKVLLEKLLREFPDVGRVYLLVRSKKDVEPKERVRREIFDSPCFELLKTSIGATEFDKLIETKVEAVVGDIEHDHIGMSDEIIKYLTSRLHVIIHMAATLDFNERIDISTKQNILGAMRMLSFARKCQIARGAGFEAFIHMSTAYTNWSRHGTEVMETVYPLGFNPHAAVQQFLDASEAEIPEVTRQYLTQYRFPNTYTLTKNMAEHLLLEARGDIPLAIIRPAIVGCAWKEPTPGWIDTLSASGGLMILCGLGVLHHMHGQKNCLADLVPVDFVVNATLLLSFRTAQRFRAYLEAAAPEGKLRDAHKVPILPTAPGMPSTLIFHAGTSSNRNPLAWGCVSDTTVEFFKKNPTQRRVSPPEVSWFKNKFAYDGVVFLQRQMPMLMYKTYARLPTASKKTKDNARKWEKAVDVSIKRVALFRPFTENAWVFNTTNLKGLEGTTTGIANPNAALPLDEAKLLSVDTDCISWRPYLYNYCWGIVKFIMKEENLLEQFSPDHSGSSQLLRAML